MNMLRGCVAYYRVSTARQGESGLGLEAQRHAVAQHLAQTREGLVAEYTEVESGRKNQRVELDRALDQCRATNAVLVIAKLDRLSRDAVFLMQLQKGDVEFRALDLPGAGKFHLGIMALVAEHEADAIRARTKAGLAALKARGVKLGRPENLTDASRRASAIARQARADARVAKAGGWARYMRDDGKSLQEIAAALTKQGEPPPRAAKLLATPGASDDRGTPKWTVTQVVRLLRAQRRLAVQQALKKRARRRQPLGRPLKVSES